MWANAVDRVFYSLDGSQQEPANISVMLLLDPPPSFHVLVFDSYSDEHQNTKLIPCPPDINDYYAETIRILDELTDALYVTSISRSLYSHMDVISLAPDYRMTLPFTRDTFDEYILASDIM